MKFPINLLGDLRYYKSEAEKWKHKYEEMKKIRDSLSAQLDEQIKANVGLTSKVEELERLLYPIEDIVRGKIQ